MSFFKLLESLGKEGITEGQIEELYASINKNNEYFDNLTPGERLDIEEKFERAPDSYAKSAEW